ncbi:MAG: gliding motility protein GldM [Chitinophagaceae bacterium]|nr:gliding motility protein GldM [Chitinophagaceae bacterium]
MSLPKEPRQKMINMMYLVLTALLALNVSSEILHAFKTVNESLITASNTVEKKNVEIFKSFERKLQDPKTAEKAAIWKPLADKAKALSDDMYKYLENLKEELIQEAGGYITDEETGLKKIKGEDNLDAATRLFISNPPEGKGKGKELYEKLKAYKEQLSNISPEILKEVAPNLPLDLSIPNPDKKKNIQESEWAYSYFHMTPTIAGITILSKFQNDVKNAESQVIEFCHKEIGEVEIVYDEFQALAGTNATYLMPGDELVITAGIGAFSKSAKPSVSVDGASASLNADGMAEYKTTVGNPGEYTKRVNINYVKPDGSTASVVKEIKYTVGVPSGLVVSTDKTRVFYQDLENPLSVIGGGGAGAEKVSVNVTGPEVSFRNAGAGTYIVTPKRLGIATVTASDGKGKPVTLQIPIKPVPAPLATVGGRAGGEMAAGIFKIQKGVAAELRDFVFEGVKWSVTSYIVYFTGKGFEEGEQLFEVNGPYFSDEVKTFLKRVQPGTTVVIDEIYVTGPGGRKKLEQNISFTLN